MYSPSRTAVQFLHLDDKGKKSRISVTLDPTVDTEIVPGTFDRPLDSPH